MKSKLNYKFIYYDNYLSFFTKNHDNSEASDGTNWFC